VDTAFLTSFVRLVQQHLEEDAARRLIIVCGGGSLARDYQAALRAVAADARDEDLDWVGIAATRVNGELMRRVFRRFCVEDLVTDPMAVAVFAGRVLVAAGWKPGFSTDNDAVVLAQRFSAATVINLSNVAKVYTGDPKKDPSARALDAVSWKEMLAIVGGAWTPGKNTPFDPTAARAAAAAHIRVVFADGRDLENLARVLAGKSFVGTTIGPD
jgi:uridylate kinase